MRDMSSKMSRKYTWASWPILPNSSRLNLLNTSRCGTIARRSRKLIYSDDPGHLRFQQYHYHHWEDNPANLIQQRLTKILGDSGVAAAVLKRRTGAVQYVLESRIARFDRLLSGNAATAHIVIEVWLIDQQDPDRILLHQQYEESIGAASATIEATIVAFSRGLDRIAQRLIADLGRVQP